MDPDQFAAFLWHLEHDPPLPPFPTPLLDALPREPAKGIVHEWKPIKEMTA